MSITDELRKYAREYKLTLNSSLEIADRIDAEHESACREAYSKGMKSIWLPDPTEYIRLPVDADGEYIHIGDKVTIYGRCVYEVDGIHFYKNNVSLSYKGESGCGCDSANNFRHYHAPTVEDVLREFVTEFNRDDSELCDGEIIEQFAAKLQLREDE